MDGVNNKFKWVIKWYKYIVSTNKEEEPSKVLQLWHRALNRLYRGYS